MMLDAIAACRSPHRLGWGLRRALGASSGADLADRHGKCPSAKGLRPNQARQKASEFA
jgi:hypothetical protein